MIILLLPVALGAWYILHVLTEHAGPKNIFAWIRNKAGNPFDCLPCLSFWFSLIFILGAGLHIFNIFILCTMIILIDALYQKLTE